MSGLDRGRPEWFATRMFGVLAVALALVASSLALTAGPADAAVDIQYDSTLGGSGRTETYPSGHEVAPDGSIVSADTGNDRVVKYNAAGAQVWTYGSFGGGTTGLNNPRDIGIDSDGNIYIADTSNARIVKVSPSGVRISQFTGPGNDRIGSPMGVTVSDDLIYVADAGKRKVRVFNTSGTQIRAFGQSGACAFSAIRDVDAAANGDIYVANYTLNNVLRMSSTGACLGQWGTKGGADGQFRNPYGVRIAADPTFGESVYVADSNNNRVQVFDLSGSFLGQLGSTGTYTQPGTHNSLRRVAVATDGSGDVWTADLWGWRLQRFDRSGGGWSYAQTIGGTAPSLSNTAVFNEVKQMGFTAAGDFWVADKVHHRVVHMSTSGSILGACGDRGWQPGQFNWPDSVSVDHATGDLWVTDTKQSRLQVMNPDCSGAVFVGSYGTGLSNFNWPTSVTIRQSDRIAFAADRYNDRVVTYDVATRTPISSYGVKGAPQLDDPRQVALDPTSGNLYVADTKHNRIVELSDSGGGSITQVRTLSPGLSAPEGVAVDDNGSIYIADTGNSRVVVLNADGSIDTTFTGPSGFYAPAALSIGPDGLLYVSDTHNDRIQVYSTSTVGPDTTRPDSVIVSPSAGSSVPAGVIPLTGTATDDSSGVATVEVSLQDEATNLWWNPATSSWGGFGWFDASLTAPGSTSTGWSVDFTGAEAGESYLVTARATDESSNVELSTPSHSFSIDSGTVPDTTRPDSVIVNPSAGSSVPAGVVPLTGTATDDSSGVATVEVSLMNRSTNLWWNPATSSWGGFGWFDASLTASGSTSTGWSVNFTGGQAGTSYWVQARAIDASGNIERDRPGLSFSVTSGTVPDTTRPDTTYTAPTFNEVLPTGQITLAGGATDNQGVASVQLTLADRITGQWWNPATSSWGNYTRFDATVDSPGATTTSWSIDLQSAVLGGSGSYWSSARAVDTSGNTDLVLPNTRFTISGDDLSPTTTYTSPSLNEIVPAGSVPLSGSAADNSGVTAVEVGLKDRNTGLWWNATAQTWGSFVRFPATVATPGATSTPWSVTFNEAAASALGGSGAYWSNARAVDGGGNVDLTPASTRFTVEVNTGNAPVYQGNLAGPALSDLTPVDITTDASFYYAIDVARYRIVKINRSTGAVVASVGGSRSTTPGGIAAARAIAIDSSGNLYVADTPNAWIQKFDNSLNFVDNWGEKGTGATQFDQVYGVAVGIGKNASGNLTEILYTVDGDGRLKKWTLNGTFIGDFSPGITLDQPRQVEVHPTTNDVWLLNSRDREIVVIDVDGNERFRFGSDGTGPGEFMGDPRGITISADGTRVFVADEGNHRIQEFDNTGAYVASIGGANPTDTDYLVDVRGIEATADNRLIATDEWDFGLKEFAFDGSLTQTYFGTPAPLDGVNSPRGLAIDSAGRIYVSDWWNQRIDRWDAGGSNPIMWGFRGTKDEPGSVNFAWDVAIQPGTDRVFLANRESHEIEVFESDGTYVTRWGIRGSANGQFEFPQGVAFAPDGTLVVSDSGNGRVQRFAINGTGGATFVEAFGATGSVLPGNLNLPAGISVADDGTVWVADTRNNRIQSYNPSSGSWTVFAGASGLSNFKLPWGVTIAPDGTVWVADSGRNRIVKMLTDGTTEFEASGLEMGAGDLNFPHAIAFGLDGTIYVSDIWNNRIIEIRE